MAIAVRNAKHFASAPVTITATAAGSVLMACYCSYGDPTGSISATGASFTQVGEINLGDGYYYSCHYAYNVSAGITSVAISTGSAYGCIVELSGCLTASNPYDASNSYDSTYGVTNLGTGVITAGGNGMATAIFVDYYGAVTGFTAGTGWTGGVFGTYSYYETRVTTSGNNYGGTSGQATAAAGEIRIAGSIVNFLELGATALSIHRSECVGTISNLG